MISVAKSRASSFWFALAVVPLLAIGAHKVTLSPFLIAKYEVSQSEWQKVMGDNEAPDDMALFVAVNKLDRDGKPVHFYGSVGNTKLEPCGGSSTSAQQLSSNPTRAAS